MRRNSSSLSSAILLMLVGAFVPVVCWIMSIQFDQNCGGYLKQAADANTVELAKQRIDIAEGDQPLSKQCSLRGVVLDKRFDFLLWFLEDCNVV